MKILLAAAALCGLIAGSSPAHSAGALLFHPFEVDGVGAWESEAFLRSSSGWRVGSSVGPAATQSEVDAVLSNLLAMEIHAACSNTDLGGFVSFCGFGVSNVDLAGVVSDSFTDPDQANAGWLQRIDGGSAFNADWSGDGGDPGGYVSVTNTSFGTAPESLALLAPDRYLGNQLAAFTSGLMFEFQGFADDPGAFVPGSSYIMLTAVPEPATFTLLAPSLVLLAWALRRRRGQRH